MTSEFAVEVDELDDVTAVRIVGELDQATLPALQAKLDPLVGAESGSILVDLSGCDFVDSSGLAAFVAAHERVTAASDRLLAICCPENQVRRLLELTGVDRAMRVADSRDEALTALRDGLAADTA